MSVSNKAGLRRLWAEPFPILCVNAFPKFDGVRGVRGKKRGPSLDIVEFLQDG